MNLLKELPELLRNDVISEETAEKIQIYFQSKAAKSSNRLFLVFGIIGALLISLGILLIFAHNWDNLSRSIKTFLAFVPLLIGQGICVYTIIKKSDSQAWRESGTAFLFISVGASIALVAQIYNIPGGNGTFILTWMLLCLPLIYLMKSSIASLLYISGITYYATHMSYASFPRTDSYMYWMLLLLVLPYYYLLFKKKPESNFIIFHNWLIPVSLFIALGTLSEAHEEWMFMAFLSLFAAFYIFGKLDFFTKQRSRNNAYKILGSIGTVVLLLMLSFNWFWEELIDTDFIFKELIISPEFLAAAFMSLLAIGLLYVLQKNKKLSSIKPISLVFIFFIPIFFLGMSSYSAVVLINLLVFAIGLATVREGAKNNHLGLLNYGLLIIATLVICRFFDSDLSFVIRGILFILVGAGFFGVNYWMLKKRKENE